MMYKERGKMFVVIRTKYNAEKGRGDQIKVCGFKSENILNIKFDDDLIQEQLIKAEVTDAERTEFKEWFEVTKKERSKVHLIKKNNSALFWVGSATKDINEELSDDQAQNIYREIKILKNKLRNLGHKEKRIQKAESEVKGEEQGIT